MIKRILIPFLLFLCFTGSLKAQSIDKNSVLASSITNEGIIKFTDSGIEYKFLPSFTVMYNNSDPKINTSGASEFNTLVPSWKLYNNDKLRVKDYYKTAELFAINPTTIKKNGNEFHISYPENSLFKLSAVIKKDSRGIPELSYTLHVKNDGFFSVGYTGAPTSNQADLQQIWQPWVWQALRFPDQSYLSIDDAAPMPATMFTKGGITFSAFVSPDAIPYKMPHGSDAKFGVLLRNQHGDAQPQVFSPVLGKPSSKLLKGAVFSYKVNVLAYKGNIDDLHQYLAYKVFGFKDYRKNSVGTLNETIENMANFAMNDYYSGWNANLKGFDYSTDVKNSVKMVSALDALSYAIISDNDEIFSRRAKPMMEYILSREKFLFSQKNEVKAQNPSHAMKGPTAEVSELTSLYNFSQKRSPVFKHYTETLYDKDRTLNLLMPSKGNTWQNFLAVYRATGDSVFLNKAKKSAKDYIEKRINKLATDFSDANAHFGAGGQFWTDFTPKWIDLIELYDETKDPIYLEAAVKGAKEYVKYIWFHPRIPDGTVKINGSGMLPIGDRHNKTNPEAMKADPMQVEAWRVSQIGLTPEASNTYTVNQGIFMTNYAPYLLRLSYLTKDSFFRDIAKAAVIGRYNNFPGYDINIDFTTHYERPDYPLQDWQKLTYNQIYYNHVWPHIALLVDYLISDVTEKSGGKISFPSQYKQGYAYLQSKVYGSSPGKFYADDQVYLWMPPKLLRQSNIQINYISGYGNGNLYFAFMNQSPAAEESDFTINQEIASFDINKEYKVTILNRKGEKTYGTLKNGHIRIRIPGNDIVSIIVNDLKIKPNFQSKVYDKNEVALSEKSFQDTNTSWGRSVGMIYSMGKNLENAFFWLEADEEKFSQVIFSYDVGNGWIKKEDNEYPYEIDFPVSEKCTSVAYKIEGIDKTGVRTVINSGELKKY